MSSIETNHQLLRLSLLL